jgi:hypothetical protein
LHPISGLALEAGRTLLEAVEALRIGERETLLYLLLSLHKEYEVRFKRR